MAKILNIIHVILHSPYTSMFLALIFMYTSVNDIIDKYHSNIQRIGIHHGIALYGLVMFLKSLIKLLQSIEKIAKAEDQLKGNSEQKS